MNIQEYIQSGIIARCVLGLASKAEQHEFESLCTRYPELVEAKYQFEIALEDKLMKEAIPPPQYLKEKVTSSVPKPSGKIYK